MKESAPGSAAHESRSGTRVALSATCMINNERTPYMFTDRKHDAPRPARLELPKLSELDAGGSPGSGGQPFRSRLMSPLGAACLAIASLSAGMWIATEWERNAANTSAAVDASDAEELRETRSELALQMMQVQRLEQVHEFSTRHEIPADLAADIYDFAIYEGLRPEVAFRLVQTESNFQRTAVSSAGAVGYTQVKPSTARWLEPSITREQLFDTRTNLRLGFRYLSMMMERYDGDERLALLAYNRGPGRVGGLLARGTDPANGYAERILGTDD